MSKSVDVLRGRVKKVERKEVKSLLQLAGCNLDKKIAFPAIADL